MPPALRPWLRAPLTLQVVSLLIGALVVAQGVTALLVVALPPPRPESVQLRELAAVARRPDAPRTGRARAVVVRRQPAAPDVGFTDDLAEAGLAKLLGVPRARVRVQLERPSRFGRMWRAAAGDMGPHGPGFRGGPGGPGGPRPFGPPQDASGPPPPNQAPAWPSPRWNMAPADIPLFEHFVAAVQQPGGEWLVLEPGAQPFPNPWQKRVIAWFVLSISIVTVLGYLFGRRITAPLREFARAAERFGSDPNAPPMRLNGPAEIGVAAAALNEMQGRIRRFVDDRTAMVGAISHDLRTPLARIRFKLEKTPPELRGSIEGDVRQMEEMITSVLTFIRDARVRPERERLDIASVVECVVDDMAERGAKVDLTVVDSPRVSGDPVALTRVVANLVENAVKYGAEAHVEVRRGDGSALVTIADRGPGLSPDELERVFEPFYRADRARNLDSGGIGLGLAVSRSLAREHGGDVVLHTRPDGLTATLLLPLAQPA